MNRAWGFPLVGAGALMLPALGIEAQLAQPGLRCCLNAAPHIHGTLSEENLPFMPSGELLGDALVPQAAPSPFQIVIRPGPSLAANAPALAAFNRAANQWRDRIFDPITVTIDADLAPLPANIIGSTGTQLLMGGFDLITEVLVFDALNEPDDDAVVAALPSSTGYSSLTPPGTNFGGRLIATKANFKAMGFTGLDDPEFGVSDGDITFSTNFAFDYDNSNGVGAGLTDFETTAAHEIGHVLGFISAVDFLNSGEADSSPVVWDLFRFPNNSPNDPESLLGFRTAARDMVPGGDHIFDDLDGELALSTGLDGIFFLGGDGYQASHFKADEFTGNFIGLMDPSLAGGDFYRVTENDLRVLDLLGYDIQRIPEPAAALALSSLLFLPRRRKVRR